MEIWQIILIVIGVVIYGYLTYLKLNTEEKNKIFIPLFSTRQMQELLKQLGPQNIADAFEINKGGYDYGWHNVLKAASILGEAKGADKIEAVRQLISNLEIDEPNLVTISAVSLGKLKATLALPYLEKLINSQPSNSVIEKEKSLKFTKLQREEYAQRIGATLTNYPTIPNSNEQHQKIREAALWAIIEIKKVESVINEKIRTSQSLNVPEAFEVFNNPQIFSLEIFLQATAALVDAKGNEIPKAIEQLISNFTHNDSNVVFTSVIILGKIGDKSVITVLNKLLEETPLEKSNFRGFISIAINQILDRVK